MKFRSVALALSAAAALGHLGSAEARECKLFTPDELKACTYRNSDGCEVPCPQAGSCPPPKNATYRCRDGTWSFSQHDRGTCSWHAGPKCHITGRNNCCS